MSAQVQPVPELLRIDLGCGKNPKEGFIGVDSRAFGQQLVHDLTKPWPWADDSVDEAHCSHFVEHLEPMERVHFVNELYRVLKKGAKCQIITPHWSSNRAFGDMTHKWPPVAEMWYYYLSKDWREKNAPHNDFYICDFDATWAWGINQALLPRNQEFQQFAISWYKEACQDLMATVTKR